ncbi:hypothetical protein [Endozoicomonas sp. GU-1]|uniref:hypothetical protein n=1 Tax=Endozoicomonas sp. GU-1 TaxID=3009078 RepID=UPI0022B5C150|nr:hypothetical protein [Endozoicomonas sp. GU-1]WBA80192.1 hypothetical protein O2T12_17850 [Endozoicomonas sp. GU-1]WBA87767.1 hypothetical protein O3276_07070 [Endozoicomonas sp. GU-1]
MTDSTTPSRSCYSGRDLSRQEPVELTLPPIDTSGPSPEVALLKRKVSQLAGSLVEEKSKRGRTEHENEHQHNPVINALEQLKALCRNRNIIIKPTLDKLIHSCPNESKMQLFSKLGIYFSHLNDAVKNTGTITSMLLCGEGTPKTKRKINQFLSTDDCDIKAIALSPVVTSISSICHAYGFPKARDVDALLKLPSLQKNGKLDRKRLSSVSTINHGKGVPKIVEELLKRQGLRIK